MFAAKRQVLGQNEERECYCLAVFDPGRPDSVPLALSEWSCDEQEVLGWGVYGFETPAHDPSVDSLLRGIISALQRNGDAHVT